MRARLPCSLASCSTATGAHAATPTTIAITSGARLPRAVLSPAPVRGGRATSEILMHAAVYRRRADVAAVVHAHPPTATGFAASGRALDRPVLAEPVVTLGPVPVVPFGTPSTSDLADRVAGAIGSAHALLLANHGALTVGETLWRAWERMETLEQFARITLVAQLLGGHQVLTREDVARLEALRVPAGYPPPPGEPRRG
jgi:L-fuculose-phosphate aldolase